MAKVLIILVRGNTSLADEQGPASIAAFLVNNGHEARLVALNKDDSKMEIIDRYKPDIIGLSVYHDELESAIYIADCIKKIDSEILVVVGGYSATYYYEDIFKRSNSIDFIMKGEGELAWKLLCDNFDNKVDVTHTPNLIYRDKTNQLHINLNAKPIEKLDLLEFSNKEILVDNEFQIAHLATTRGCFENCSFCYSHKFFDPSGSVRWRGKDPEKIIAEIRKLVTEYNIHRVVFDDASFEDSYQGLSRMERILDLILEANLEFTFEVFFRASIYRRLSDELLQKLIDAGLSSVFIGIESFNEKELRIFNKHVEVIDNDKVIEYFRNRKINVQIGFINFTPYSEVWTLRKNAYYLHKHHFINSCLISNKLRAYKGTDLYTKLVNDKLIPSNNSLDYYEYSYEKPDINYFCEYIIKKFNDINIEKGSNIQSIDWYLYFTYPRYISYYRSLFGKMKVGFEQDLDKWEDEYFKIIKENSELYFKWYNALLDLFEYGWDENEASKICCEIDISNTSMEVLNKLKVLLKHFHYQIIKSNRTLVKYLINDSPK